MGTLNVAKNDILALMKKYYDRNHGLPKPSSPQDVEKNGFVLKAHAEKISEYCFYNRLCVIFRDAGEFSLKRIGEGNPCKGHSILSKTVKKKGKCWTYKLPKGSGMDISSYAGYVGCGDGTTPPTLKNLYAVSKDLKKYCLVDLNLKKGEDDTNRIYTGDYDMEDLLTVQGGKLNRILAATPNEKSTIDGLNHCMMNGTKREQYLKDFNRTSQCPYSLIRHGAQSSFVSFLISYEGKDELSKYYNESGRDYIAFVNKLQKLALKIEDSRLCAFDETGKIYILNKIEDIYCFYKSKNILDQIPFYYFLYDLENNQCKVEEEKRIINFAKNVIAELLEYVANE